MFEVMKMTTMKLVALTRLRWFLLRHRTARASTAVEKSRMASSSTNVSFLALYTALHRGFFKDEGIDWKLSSCRQI